MEFNIKHYTDATSKELKQILRDAETDISLLQLIDDCWTEECALLSEITAKIRIELARRDVNNYQNN